MPKIMKVEVKNYKPFHGHDGQGFDCTVYINGKRTAIVSDDGWGGPLNWLPVGDYKSEAFQTNGSRFHDFTELCKQLPPEEVVFDGEPTSIDMDWELWIEKLLELADIKRQASGGKIIARNSDGEFHVVGKGYKKAHRETILAQLDKKLPNSFLVNGCKVEAELETVPIAAASK